MSLLSSLLTDRSKNDIFRSLKHRNYRLFFGGQSISLIGTWMQRVAMAWLVYRLSNSALVLGIVAFAGQIPGFLLTPLGGVAADRYNRYKLLIITQILSLIQAAVLSLLVLTGSVEIWHLVLLNIFLGTINAFDMPVRQAFVVEMIEKREDLANAIALNSSMVNTAKMLGPSIAGVLIAAVGEGMCFLLNAVSYLAVIASLFLMKINKVQIKSSSATAWQQLKGGFAYAFGFAPIKYIIALLALVSLTGMSYIVLMPIFAKDILHGGPRTLGFLMGASGIGALTGVVYLAARKTVLGLEKIIVIASGLFGIGLVCFSLSASIWPSMFFMLLAGLGMMVQMASCNTVLQTMVDDDVRGRVMGFYIMAFIGVTPFGSLLAGGLAHIIGAANTLLINGAFCTLGSVLFAIKLPSLRKMIHPVYARKGIVPEVTKGIQTATELTVPPED
jgi:MFS family permease